jgi:phosphate/sulfate permease
MIDQMANDSEFAKWVITLGVGGVLAFIMFMFYRKDVKQYTELWKAQSEMLMSVVKENTTAHVINAESNRQLVSIVSAFHKRMDVINIEERRRDQSHFEERRGPV